MMINEYGMIDVSRDVFFSTVASGNVHPRPVGNWDNALGYLTEWLHPSGSGPVLGMSIGLESMGNQRWMVSREFSGTQTA